MHVPISLAHALLYLKDAAEVMPRLTYPAPRSFKSPSPGITGSLALSFTMVTNLVYFTSRF